VNVRFLAYFGQGIAGFEPFGFAAQIGGHARTEVIGEGQEDSGPNNALQQAAPRLPGEFGAS